MKKLTLFILAFFMPVALNAQPVFQSEDHQFRVVTVAEALEHPWSLAFLPGGDMLVTERPGRLNLIRRDGRRLQVEGLPEIAAYGQGGALDVLVHPDFARNQVIFLAHAAGSFMSGYGTEVIRAQLNGPRLTDVQTIFRADPKIRFNRVHFGARLLWGPDDMLYITLGERGERDMAQDPANHLGSIIRITPDGRIPEDNPFAEHPEYRPEIFTYGNRNVQGIARRPGTEQIWFHEHGPKGGDEVNILKSGANYGWPEVTYGVNYSGLPITDKRTAPGITDPVIQWTPSIAPSGMSFYTGDAFPAWRGDLFVGALVLTHLRRLELEGNEIVHQEVLLEDLGERIRDVVTGPDGFLYLLTDHPQGKILRLEGLE